MPSPDYTPAELRALGRAGEPVPAGKVCRFDNIASFRPGIWNGKPFDAQFIKALSDNFQKYSAGDSPYYRPYVSINHKDFAAADGGISLRDLRFGVIRGARVNPGGVLALDAAEVPEVVGSMRNAGLLTDPSIEFFEPVFDESGKQIDGFRRQDGTLEPGPVLKCLTLLGSEAPAVKGLPPLPAAKFSHGGKVSRFGANVMDRASILAALQAMKVDTSVIPDSVPDEVLAAWLASLQAANSGSATAPGAGDATQQMSDVTTPAITPTVIPPTPTPDPTAVTVPGIGPGQQPSQVVLKFADQASAQAFGGLLTGLQHQMRAIGGQVASLNTVTAAHANRDKEARVSRFLDTLATPDREGKVRITPAQKGTLYPLLMKCDTVTVRKFADGKTTGSEMDEMERSILSTYQPIKTFGDKLKDPATGPNGGGLTPETRKMILSGSSAGRALLAKQTAKAS